MNPACFALELVRFPVVLLCVAAAFACAATSPTKGASERTGRVETTFALVGLPCPSAGRGLEGWLRSHPSISRASFDVQTVTMSVVHDTSELSISELGDLIEARGVRVVLGLERGSIRPPVIFPRELDVSSLPEANEDEIEDHLVSGKVTVFHFRAPSGEVCSDLDMVLAVLMQSRDDIALRRLASSGVPLVVVYAATAHRHGPFLEGDIEAIEAAILEAAGEESVRLPD